MQAITRRELELILHAASPHVNGRDTALACENLYLHLDKIPQAIQKIGKLEKYIDDYLEKYDPNLKTTLEAYIEAHIQFVLLIKIKRLLHEKT